MMEKRIRRASAHGSRAVMVKVYLCFGLQITDRDLAVVLKEVKVERIGSRNRYRTSEISFQSQ